MNTRAEETLYFLLWSVALLMRPTFRNMTDPSESWTCRTATEPPVSRLLKRKWLRVNRLGPGDRLFRLTEPGRLRALGGRDPLTQWSRNWDGLWRLVVFDVPVKHNAQRARLQRRLRARRYGCLQGSVWVAPDFLAGEKEALRQGDIQVRSFLVLEARPGAGESDLEIVQGAWDFDELNRLYRVYLNVLDRRPDRRRLQTQGKQVLASWANDERKAWLAAIRFDPMLPRGLHPPGYLGPDAFRQRQEALGLAGRAWLWGQSKFGDVLRAG
ncbi:MAG TPA: hypothetical protein VMN36_18275 [Verrucomicrobiales bacterium]|nr:hypothetical protein [Verrucomicrobiales bacterium]